jgi:hypothetical protein
VIDQIVEQLDLGGIGNAEQRRIERIERDIAQVTDVGLPIMQVHGADEVVSGKTPPFVALNAKPNNNTTHDVVLVELHFTFDRVELTVNILDIDRDIAVLLAFASRRQGADNRRSELALASQHRQCGIG